ncbi:MAG: cation:proton antiporter, partial [Deltaproteobacteria bacterium]|nr:cation:proton antiporter [Deltaproteobacteria bacterium]
MTQFLLQGLAAIILLGVFAQWLAWRLRLPSLLLLLLAGFLAGPVLGVWAPEYSLNPDVLFGEVLSPLVALAIAIILFEEGLSFRFSELGRVGTVVRALVSVGALVSWFLIAVGANLFVSLSAPLS